MAPSGQAVMGYIFITTIIDVIGLIIIIPVILKLIMNLTWQNNHVASRSSKHPDVLYNRIF